MFSGKARYEHRFQHRDKVAQQAHRVGLAQALRACCSRSCFSFGGLGIQRSGAIRRRTLAHVFISYIRENDSAVARLCRELRRVGLEVWLDREQIKPGQRWKNAIRSAIRDGAFFVACFSKEYVERARSYMNEELLVAIEELRQRPAERVWFIPVRLSACQVPNMEIGGGSTLRDLQWVDLGKNWRAGVRALLETFQPITPSLKNVSGKRDPLEVALEMLFQSTLQQTSYHSFARRLELLVRCTHSFISEWSPFNTPYSAVSLVKGSNLTMTKASFDYLRGWAASGSSLPDAPLAFDLEKLMPGGLTAAVWNDGESFLSSEVDRRDDSAAIEFWDRIVGSSASDRYFAGAKILARDDADIGTLTISGKEPSEVKGRLSEFESDLLSSLKIVAKVLGRSLEHMVA